MQYQFHDQKLGQVREWWTAPFRHEDSWFQEGEVKVLWNHTFSSCKWETLGCRPVGHDQWNIRLIWIPDPQGHIFSLVFTFPPLLLVFLFSVITRQSLQQNSLKHSLKFWNWADAIRSACTAGHGGHLMELAQSLALFSHCCCPVVLWLPAMELFQCRRVWANEELLCSLNPASASKERKINYKVACAVVQLLEDLSSWYPICYWMGF